MKYLKQFITEYMDYLECHRELDTVEAPRILQRRKHIDKIILSTKSKPKRLSKSNLLLRP